MTTTKKILLPISAVALSFLAVACPNHEELPRSFMPVAEAQETAAPAERTALERTVAREIHFAAGESELGADEQNAFDTFLATAGARNHIRELKLVLWLPVDSTEQDHALVRERVAYLTGLLRAHQVPYQAVMFESPFYGDSQGSLMAVLE